MPELIFDLVGPFVVQFKQGSGKTPGTAYVSAPLCDNHHANILTDSDDVFVPGNGDSRKARYVYHFVDSSAPKGAPMYKFVDAAHEKLLLLVPFDCTPLEGGSDQCHLVLKIPCPDYVIPLHSERVWIHKNTARNCWVTCEDHQDIVDSKRARGLRFIYQDCPTMPEIGVPGLGKAFSSETIGISRAPHYSMTFRYADTGEMSPGHADAYSCFHNSRSMWSPAATGCDLSEWRVDYDDLEHFSMEGGGPRPRDCGAAVIVMQDWK
jgi:hypothetical protein